MDVNILNSTKIRENRIYHEDSIPYIDFTVTINIVKNIFSKMIGIMYG